MAEPAPLDPRSRELLDAFRRRTDAPLEPSRVEPVWRKARAGARAAVRVKWAGRLGVAAAAALVLGVLGARREKNPEVAAEAGASWQRRGNTVVLARGKLRVGAPGDVVVVSTPHVQITLNDARALVEVTSGATLLSVESGDVVYRSAGGTGHLEAGAHVTIEEPAPKAAAAESTLAAETALYDVARQARVRGAWGEAAAALRKHQAQFPGGVFAPEVSLALIAVLKAQGDVKAAAAEADRFLARFPAEPQAESVKAWRNNLEGSR